MKLLIIIPTYNEQENIKKLIENIFAYTPNVSILIIDDSSPDGTAATIKKLQKEFYNLHFIIRSSKSGLARAYIDGFKWGIEKNFDTFLQMDADFSHNPKYIPEMTKQIQINDVVIGSRLVKGGGIKNRSALRQMITFLGSLYARIILNCPMKDLTGGFNMWNLATINKIDLDNIICIGYGFQIEMKYRAFKAGSKITEIPIIFEERNYGKSKMSIGILFEALIKIFRIKFL